MTFPLFLHRLAPSLVHIPLNRVPLFRREPYVVTIHDMASLLFGAGSSLRMQVRRYLLRRRLLRAKRIIAVSEATRRDVHDALGIPADRIRLAYNAPNPDLFRPAAVAPAASWNATRSTIPSCSKRATSARRRTFRVWSKLSRWPANTSRATPFTATRTSSSLATRSRVIPSVRLAVIRTRVEKPVRFLGFVPFRNPAHLF